MTTEEMKEKAVAKVEADNSGPGYANFKAVRVFENIMEGTVVSVNFESPTRKDDSNQVYFGKNEIRTSRWPSDVLSAVSGSRERNWFFRFIELAGIGGVIAFLLVIIFSVLLCVLAFSTAKENSTVLEVVKLSFTVMLGYFFGSQTAAKRST